MPDINDLPAEVLLEIFSHLRNDNTDLVLDYLVDSRNGCTALSPRGHVLRAGWARLAHIINTGYAEISIFKAMDVCKLWRELGLNVLYSTNLSEWNEEQRAEAARELLLTSRGIEVMTKWKREDDRYERYITLLDNFENTFDKVVSVCFAVLLIVIIVAIVMAYSV